MANNNGDAVAAEDNVNALTPYQGGERWLISISMKLPDALSDVLEEAQLDQLEFMNIQVPAELRAGDRAIFGAILDALLHHRAEPKHEAQNLFDKLTAQNQYIRKSGVRAISFIDKCLKGDNTQAGNSAM